ncbi:MAG: hypothetical protein HY040_10535 [Planctomycetes bacterium]|nr:hypothetical protein [Planctomycetota bacterium]
MKLPSELSVAAMAAIISEIQKILWLDATTAGEVWNVDKEWDSETVERVAAVLEEHGLRPDTASPAIIGDSD